MGSCSSAASVTWFQNYFTTSPPLGPGRGNRVSFIHGVEFWNPPPEIQIGVSGKRNPLLPAVASSSESQLDLEVAASDDETQELLPDQEDSPTVHIRIQLRRECQFGEQFHVVGDHPTIGLWDPLDAAPMVWSDGHVWTAELDVPAGKLIQFKFILRDVSGEILWQPGPNRVLQTRETSKVIVVFGDWEKVAIQQLTQERNLDRQYEESDELIIHEEEQQLRNDAAAGSNDEKGEPLLVPESYTGSIASLNGEAVAMVAENNEHHSSVQFQESSYLRKELQVERNVDISSIEVGDLRFNSHAISNNDDLKMGTDILEMKQEIPVLVPGLTPCLITPAEYSNAVDEEVELDTCDNARNAIGGNSEQECLHHDRKNQIQLDLKQEAIEVYQENKEEEEEEEVQEVIAEVVIFDKEHEPDQGLELVLYEGQDNRSKGILHNDFKWGMETLRRFLDKLGFRLQL